MFRNPQPFLFWVAAAACAVGQLAVLRAMLAGRAPGTSRHPVARWTEVAWVVLPTVALAVVLYATWRDVQRQASSPLPTAAPAEAPAARPVLGVKS